MAAGCAKWDDPNFWYQSARHEPVQYETMGFLSFSDEGKTGYRDDKIDDLTYKVMVWGTRVTALERTVDMALLRAARLGKELGHDAFVVQDSATRIHCWAVNQAQVRLSATPITNLTVRYGSPETVVGIGTVLLVGEVEKAVVVRLAASDVTDQTMRADFTDNWRVCNG
jgi:hypothetical protein